MPKERHRNFFLIPLTAVCRHWDLCCDCESGWGHYIYCKG